MTALQAVDVTEERLRADRTRKRQHLVQSGQVYFARHTRVLQYRFYFGSKNEESIDDGVKERANTKLIAREEECAVLAIVDRERKLGIQLVKKAHALFFIKMDEHLDVGFGLKTVSLLLEFSRQLAVVEDLSVATQNQ